MISHQEDMDESDISDVTILAVGGCLTLCMALVCAAFMYKVWNERQMTREYHEQSVQLTRIADSLSR